MYDEDDHCTCTITPFGMFDDFQIDYDQNCPIHGEKY